MTVVQANSSPIETVNTSDIADIAFLFRGIQGKSAISFSITLPSHWLRGMEAFEVCRLDYAAFSRHLLTSNKTST